MLLLGSLHVCSGKRLRVHERLSWDHPVELGYVESGPGTVQ